MRISVTGWAQVESRRNPQTPILFVMWHEILMVSLYFLKKRNLVIMVSLNRDGEIAADIGDKLGYQIVRGSSSRRGRDALEEMIDLFQKNKHLGALTVDGPRGPRRVVKPGAIIIAKKTDAILIPIGVAGSNIKRLEKSWDKFNVFLPFSRVHLHFGKPIIFQRNFEQNLENIQNKINSAQKRAKDFIDK